MNLSQVEWEDGYVVPETTRAATAEPWHGLIRVGRPVILDAVKVYRASKQRDPLMGLLVGESDFYYVRLPVSFRPLEDVHLTLVSVAVDLEGSGNGAEAWSMEPQKIEEELKVGLEAKIEAGLKFTPTELSSSIGSSEEYIVYQPLIESFNLGRHDPAWEFRPTKGRTLSGNQLLHLVVRQPRRTTSQCSVTVNGDAEDRRGIFSFLWRPMRKAEGKPFSFTCPNEPAE
jgi:hypothetical protein